MVGFGKINKVWVINRILWKCLRIFSDQYYSDLILERIIYLKIV